MYPTNRVSFHNSDLSIIRGADLKPFKFDIIIENKHDHTFGILS